MDLFFIVWSLYAFVVITAGEAACNYRSAVPVSTMKAINDYTDASVDVCARLSPGIEYIEYSASAVTAHSVHIIGDNSTIRCNESVVLPHTDYSIFPLVFENVESVQVQNVTFENCVRALQLIQVKEVEFIGCTFRNFTVGGAVEISNSPIIRVEHCRFENNTALGIGTRTFSGNSGGLSIGYDKSPRLESLKNIFPVISIVSSEFVGNTATAIVNYQYPLLEVLRTGVYNQRGGGLAFYIASTNYSATFSINDCVFQENSARAVGGGVYTFFGGAQNSHGVTVERTRFINNRATYVGALMFSLSTEDSVSYPNQVLVSECFFQSNQALIISGAVAAYQNNVKGNLNSVNVTNTHFIGNSAEIGAAFFLQTIVTTRNVRRRNRINFQNCTFSMNQAKRGVVFLIRNAAAFIDITFQQNMGPSIRALDALVQFGGNVTFADNGILQGGLSGALHMSSFAQAQLLKGAHIYFYNNTGRIGACIVVNVPVSEAAFRPQIYNPRCFLQYEEPATPPAEWEVQMVFENNIAAVGPVVYTSNVFDCSWYSLQDPYFSNDFNLYWSFMQIRNNYVIVADESSKGSVVESIDEQYIQTEVSSIVLSGNTNLSGAPGGSFQLQAAALDEFGHNTTAFFEISQYNGEVSKFLPSVLPSVAGVGVIDFTYYSSNPNITTYGFVGAFFTSTDEVSPVNFTLQHSECWPGYVLRTDLRNEQCVCEETDEVASCIPDRSGILLSDGLWGAPPSWSMTLVAFTCPVGYCNCTGYANISEGCLFLYNDQFPVCQKDRTGILCGQCRGNSSSVGMLTNQCRPYTASFPYYYWLIPLYVLIVVPLLVCIVRFSIHVPTVFRSFIFYVQISPIAVEYLTNFRLRTDIMYCFSSTMALYVPYDFSLRAGMTALEAYGLRYIPFLLALIVVPLSARIKHHSKYWNGVWTVILLMYVMMVHTSVSLLHCPTLSQPGGDSITVWFFDGSVACYENEHILLTIIALASLIFVGVLILAVAFLVNYHSIRKKIRKLPERLEACEKALTRGIREQCKWWPVFELCSRFIFVTAVTLSAGRIVVPLVLSLVILCAHTFFKPYISRLANYSEMLVLLILVLLLSLGNVNELKEFRRERFTLWPVFYFPVIIGAAFAVVYATFVLVLLVKKHKDSLKQLFKRKKAPTNNIALRSLSIARDPGVITRTTVSLFDDIENETYMQMEASEEY